jgi:hypothetical protein
VPPDGGGHWGVERWREGLRALAFNGWRAGDRSPVLRLRQGYGACTLLAAGYLIFNNIFINFYGINVIFYSFKQVCKRFHFCNFIILILK